MKYLLDTCLLSELVRPAPHPAVLGWMGERASADLFVSALTLAELERASCDCHLRAAKAS